MAGMDNTTSLDINNTCTVFAESEVVSLLASGYTLADISRAVHRAIAERIISFSERIKKGNQIVLTGGVAKNIGLLRALEGKLNTKIEVTEKAQENGAIGAALLAMNL